MDRAEMRRLPAQLRKVMDQGIAQAVKLGHKIGHVEVEDGWHAAVAACLVCDLIVAVDISEEPYIFGRAPKKKCK